MATRSGQGRRTVTEVSSRVLRALAEVLTELGQHGRNSPQAALRGVVASLPVPSTASLVAPHSRSAEFVACTHEQAHRLDAVQYEVDDGPSVRAAHTGGLVVADTTQVRLHWPRFVRSAREERVHSFLCAPLTEDGRVAITLNLYCARAHAFDVFDGTGGGNGTALITAVVRALREITSRSGIEVTQGGFDPAAGGGRDQIGVQDPGEPGDGPAQPFGGAELGVPPELPTGQRDVGTPPPGVVGDPGDVGDR